MNRIRENRTINRISKNKWQISGFNKCCETVLLHIAGKVISLDNDGIFRTQEDEDIIGEAAYLTCKCKDKPISIMFDPLLKPSEPVISAKLISIVCDEHSSSPLCTGYVMCLIRSTKPSHIAAYVQFSDRVIAGTTIVNMQRSLHSRIIEREVRIDFKTDNSIEDIESDGIVISSLIAPRTTRLITKYTVSAKRLLPQLDDHSTMSIVNDFDDPSESEASDVKLTKVEVKSLINNNKYLLQKTKQEDTLLSNSSKQNNILLKSTSSSRSAIKDKIQDIDEKKETSIVEVINTSDVQECKIEDNSIKLNVVPVTLENNHIVADKHIENDICIKHEESNEIKQQQDNSIKVEIQPQIKQNDDMLLSSSSKSIKKDNIIEVKQQDDLINVALQQQEQERNAVIAKNNAIVCVVKQQQCDVSAIKQECNVNVLQKNNQIIPEQQTQNCVIVSKDEDIMALYGINKHTEQTNKLQVIDTSANKDNKHRTKIKHDDDNVKLKHVSVVKKDTEHKHKKRNTTDNPIRLIKRIKGEKIAGNPLITKVSSKNNKVLRNNKLIKVSNTNEESKKSSEVIKFADSFGNNFIAEPNSKGTISSFTFTSNTNSDVFVAKHINHKLYSFETHSYKYHVDTGLCMAYTYPFGITGTGCLSTGVIIDHGNKIMRFNDPYGNRFISSNMFIDPLTFIQIPNTETKSYPSVYNPDTKTYSFKTENFSYVVSSFPKENGVATSTLSFQDCEPKVILSTAMFITN